MRRIPRATLASRAALCKQARAKEGPMEHDVEKVTELHAQEEQHFEAKIIGSDGRGQESHLEDEGGVLAE
eukprot:4770572-Pyramimonas_sp.AAC.1